MSEPSPTGQKKQDFTASSSPSYRSQPPEKAKQTGWVGWVVFAGIMMILIGAFQVVAGLIALFRNTYYLVTSSGLLMSVNYTAWGWVHLILGLILAAGGFAVMSGLMWGRVIGIIFASLSALANLGFLAAYPVWSVLMIALDVVVIFALTVHGAEVKD